MLIGQFWGTSDAAGIPGAFCNCDVCREARELGGRYQRLRSCFRLTDKIMIDLGADAVCQSMKYGSLCDVEHVFITHTHDDHLNPFVMMGTWWSRTREIPLNYYFTDKAHDIVECWRNSDWLIKGSTRTLEEAKKISFHEIEYAKEYDADGITVIPFKGNHLGNLKESSAMYLFALPDGRTLFYGLDSGMYPEETINELKKYKIDIFISESTCGTRRVENYPYHMDIFTVCELSKILFEQGTLTPNSRIYLTHINHSTSHTQMEEAVKELNFPVETIVAYDGLKVF